MRLLDQKGAFHIQCVKLTYNLTGPAGLAKYLTLNLLC